MNFFITIILSSSIVLFSSCSTIQAVSGEDMKDLSVLKIGTDRHAVLAELKAPVFSEIKGGNRIDIFNIIQGQHGLFKAGKALGYGVLAVSTLGVSELFMSPIEGTTGKGAELQFKVIYNSDDRIQQVVVLKDERWIPIQDLQQE